MSGRQEVLEQLYEGSISPDEAEEMLRPKVPYVTITLLPESGIHVELQNWTGISESMMERMYYEMVRANHRHRAAGIKLMHEEKINAAS